MADDDRPDNASRLLSLLSCPDCGVTMTLTQIKPGEPGYQRLTFRCEACHRSDTILVKTKEAGPTG